MCVVGGVRHVGYCENELFYLDGDKFGKYETKELSSVDGNPFSFDFTIAQQDNWHHVS